MRKVMQKCGIYEIRNMVNQKIYIGSAVNFNNRKRTHLYQLRNNIHGNTHLQYSFNKYGEAAFTFNFLFYCDYDNLLLYEQRTIDALSPEYNQRIVAYSNRGIKYSDEVKKKWGDIRRGKPLGPFSDEHKKNISKSKIGKVYNLGHFVSNETKRKISESHTGKCLSDEHKKKLSIAGKGRIISDETKKKMSESRKGIVYSDEVKRNISLGRLAMFRKRTMEYWSEVT